MYCQENGKLDGEAIFLLFGNFLVHVSCCFWQKKIEIIKNICFNFLSYFVYFSSMIDFLF